MTRAKPTAEAVGDLQADAVLLAERLGSFSVAAIKFDAIPGTDGAFSADAVLLDTVEGALTVDAVITGAQEGALLVDAWVETTPVAGLALDAIIATSQPGSPERSRRRLARQRGSRRGSRPP